MQIKTRHQTSFHTELGDTGFISATHFHNYSFESSIPSHDQTFLKKGQRF